MRQRLTTYPIGGVLLATLVVGVCLAFLSGEPSRAASAPNPIPTENAKAGTGNWQPRYDDIAVANMHALEGYASEVSILPGGTIHLHVSTSPSARYRVEVYRLGWYGGNGGRLIGCVPSCSSDKQGTAYPIPDLDANGYVDAGWPVTDTFTIPSDSVSGYFEAKLVLTSGSPVGATRNIPVIVREPPGQHATALVVAPVNTWQAYNPWGGKSLYDFQSTSFVPAVKVSFNRPFHPAHPSLEYDLNLLRWLEREGYNVSYTTDVDVSLDPSSLLDHTLVITAGHDEYWTKEERDAFENARDHGVNLAFMGANTAYWQARLEGGGRTLVEYRNATTDPVSDPSLDTVQFRDLVPSRSECSLLGVAYSGGSLTDVALYDLPVVPSALGHAWFANTGFTSSSVVRQAVGYEWDQVIPGCDPPGSKLTTLFHYDDGPPADTVTYTAPSGAIVFSTGTLGFVDALDNYTDGVVDTRLQQFMRNAMADLMVAHVAAPSTPGNLTPPSVSGTPLVGQTLAASTGSWSGDPTSFSYAWRRCDLSGSACSTISGATAPTYVLGAADAASTIRVRVTATNALGSSDPVDSAPTSDVLTSGGGGGSFGATAPGAASGAPGEGYKFGSGYQLATAGTANAFEFYARGGSVAQSFVAALYSSNGGAPATLLAASPAVTVAAGQAAGWVSASLPSTVLPPGSYYLVLLSKATSQGASIYFDASQGPDGVYNENAGPAPTATFGTASTEPRRWSYRVQLTTSGGAPPDPPENTSLPAVSGITQQGEQLTTSNGAWSNNPTSFAVQWQRCDLEAACFDIAGATSSVYVLKTGDVGSSLRSIVTAANAGGAGTPAASTPTAVVEAIPVPLNSLPPSVSGSAQQGQTLSATSGVWTNSPTSYGYQWRRCDTGGGGCVDIAGATAATRLLQAADVGSTLRVRVIATNAGGPSSPADSNATALVTAAPVPANTALPAVSGTAQQGQTLTASNGNWTNSPTSYSYGWRRCDTGGGSCVDIAGASSPSLLLTAADVGATLRIRVTASNAGGAGSPADSNPTAVVSAAAAPTTFGAQNPGGNSTSPGSGYKFGSPYTLSAAAAATRFDFYTRGGSAAQSFTPAIYASNGSGPTTLLATGATVTVAAGKAAGWVSSTLPSTNLAAGTYYLVLLSATTSNAAFIYWDNGAQSDGIYNENNGANPTTPFGTTNTEPRKYSYRVAVG